MITSNYKSSSAARVLTKKHPIPKDCFEENVYKLLPTIIPLPERPPRYHSQYSEDVRKKFKAVKKPIGSLGPPKVIGNPTAEFVRKRDGLIKYKLVEKHERAVGNSKPPLPKSAPVIVVDRTKKDYLTMNKAASANTALIKPQKPEINYRVKKDYGKTPDYLTKRVQEQSELITKTTREKREKDEKDALMRKGIVPLPESERQRLLEGLRNNWEKLNSEYMKLSLTVDTLPKINRKVSLERQLKQYEDQMSKLSHPKILVSFKV